MGEWLVYDLMVGWWSPEGHMFWNGRRGTMMYPNLKSCHNMSHISYCWLVTSYSIPSISHKNLNFQGLNHMCHEFSILEVTHRESPVTFRQKQELEGEIFGLDIIRRRDRTGTLQASNMINMACCEIHSNCGFSWEMFDNQLSIVDFR